jgi:DNA repair exonuclease SbcCD ATPase subunit
MLEKILGKLNDINDLIKTKEVEKALFKKQHEKVENELEEHKMQLLENELIQLIYKEASTKAKLAVKSSIEDIVSKALNIVFGGNHRFIIEMVERRNQMELDFYIDDGYVRIHLKKPFAGKGGSKVSLASIAIKLALVVQTNTTGLLCLDEITKMVDNESRPNVVYFIKEFSENFNKQVIFITQDHELAEVADNVLFIDKLNGKAVVSRRDLCQDEYLGESQEYTLRSSEVLNI